MECLRKLFGSLLHERFAYIHSFIHSFLLENGLRNEDVALGVVLGLGIVASGASHPAERGSMCVCANPVHMLLIFLHVTMFIYKHEFILTPPS